MVDPRQVERDHEVPGDTPTKSHRTRPALISRVDGSEQHKVREARTLLFQLVSPATCMPEWLIHCVNVLRVYIEQPVVLLVAKGRQRLAQDQATAAARAYCWCLAATPCACALWRSVARCQHNNQGGVAFLTALRAGPPI